MPHGSFIRGSDRSVLLDWFRPNAAWQLHPRVRSFGSAPSVPPECRMAASSEGPIVRFRPNAAWQLNPRLRLFGSARLVPPECRMAASSEGPIVRFRPNAAWQLHPRVRSFGSAPSVPPECRMAASSEGPIVRFCSIGSARMPHGSLIRGSDCSVPIVRFRSNAILHPWF